MAKNTAIQVQPRPMESGQATIELSHNGVEEICAGLRPLLADTFALYLKTKNFHWHMSGPHFRDYHFLLDEQAEQIFAMADEVAERARKLGEPRSIPSRTLPGTSACTTTTKNPYARRIC